MKKFLGKIFFCVIVAVLMILVLVNSVNANEDEFFEEIGEEISEEFGEVESIELVEDSESFEEWANSDDESLIMPRTFDMSVDMLNEETDLEEVDNKFNITASNNTLLGASAYESRYDARNNMNVVVRNQMQTDTCWAFSVTTLFSHSLQATNPARYNSKTNGGAVTPMFSTRHMDYATSNSFTNGTSPIGYNRGTERGGNALIGLHYATTGYGVITENQMPFENNKNKISINSIYNKNVEYKVNDYYEFPTIKKRVNSMNNLEYYTTGTIYTNAQVTTLRDQIKKHIKTYGGVETTIHQNSAYFGADNKSYFCYNNLAANHAVTIIGWDDNYSRTNFKSNNLPRSNGAYIVLNSHGTGVYENGIMYVSYEDRQIEESIIGVGKVENKNYDRVYQYDDLTYSTTYTIASKNLWIGQKYARKTNKNEKQEYINEVSAYVLQDSTVEVWINSKNDDLVNGRRLVKTVSGLKAGFHVIKLDAPVLIEGDRFAIEEVIKVNSDKVYFPIEATRTSYTNGNPSIWSTAKSARGQSFYGTTGNTWKDLYDVTYNTANQIAGGDCMIKIYTTEKNIQKAPVQNAPVQNTQPQQKTQTTQVQMQFQDVKTSDWFYNSVKYVYSKGIIRGYSAQKFGPQDKVTRGMLVAIIYNCENQPAVSGSNKFPDVQDRNQYYYNAVKWASDNGIVKGYDNGTFGPNKPVTREQMAVFLQRYAAYKNKLTSQRNTINTYNDADSVSGFAMDAMRWANTNKVINGTADRYLKPLGTATRAEVAAMLENFDKNILGK